MRRKVIKILTVVLLVLFVLLALFAGWTWYQMNVAQSLQTGDAQTGATLGGLVIPQTAVLYGMLAGFFLLITTASIWITYRLMMFPPEDEDKIEE